jgi:hypothetical protein
VRELRGVREVEAELVGTHRRARLGHVVAEHLAQRCLQQVRRCVVRHRREADAPGHDSADTVTGAEALAAEEEHLVPVEPVRVHELGAHATRVVALDPSLVRDLAATRGVERRLAQLGEKRAVTELLERPELREHVDLGVADEVRGEARVGGEVCGPLNHSTLTAAARDLAVTLHLLPVAVDVDLVSALRRQLDGELDREPVGGGELERVLGADVPARELVELLHPAVERLPEPLLLGAHDPLDLIGVLDHLGIPRADLLDDDPRQRVHGRQADASRLDDGAADQAPQDVAAALVRGGDALGDEERDAAPVVAEHAVRLRRLGRVAVRDTGFTRDPVHDELKPVGVEDRLHALQQHRAALEPQPRVDVLLRQRRQRAVGGEVELHEHEVPELEEPLAPLAAGCAVDLTAAVLLAAVVVELRARATRPGLAGRSPEILGARQRHDSLARDADPLPPRNRDLVLAEP